jgi:hypothetical protein
VNTKSLRTERKSKPRVAATKRAASKPKKSTRARKAGPLAIPKLITTVSWLWRRKKAS